MNKPTHPSSLSFTRAHPLAWATAALAVVTLMGCSTAGSVGSAKPAAAQQAHAQQASLGQASTSLVCSLKPAANGYAGTCLVPCAVNALAVNFDGVDAARACTGAPRSVETTLATTDVANRWLGTMQGVKPEDPTRFEVVPNKHSASTSAPAPGGTGAVARTPFGWFAVTEVRQDKDQLSLTVDTSRQVRPTADDVAIIDRAIALIPHPQQWNKDDNRQCAAAAQKLSLFCSLMQATTEIAGGVHYRQPAMQAVREELNLVDASRIKTHRIMDYNNHPDTTLAEVHALLSRAKLRVQGQLR
jgi:hypothetical protein